MFISNTDRLKREILFSLKQYTDSLLESLWVLTRIVGLVEMCTWQLLYRNVNFFVKIFLSKGMFTVTLYFQFMYLKKKKYIPAVVQLEKKNLIVVVDNYLCSYYQSIKCLCHKFNQSNVSTLYFTNKHELKDKETFWLYF